MMTIDDTHLFYPGQSPCGSELFGLFGLFGLLGHLCDHRPRACELVPDARSPAGTPVGVRTRVWLWKRARVSGAVCECVYMRRCVCGEVELWRKCNEEEKQKKRRRKRRRGEDQENQLLATDLAPNLEDNIRSHHTTTHHITPHHTTPHHTHHITPHHITPHHITPALCP